MKYSLALKDLPFEPEQRQVIYVENEYDEHTNAIIKDNYERIKWSFKRANLDFVYLPMFFNDEEIKEKVLYYAPYLTEEIMEKVELRSSHLLGYMSHPENKEKIKPSFLFNPAIINDEWIFKGLTIDIDGDDKNIIIQRFDSLVSDIEEEIASEQPKFSLSFDDKFPKPPKMTGEAATPSSPQVEYSSTGIRFHKMEMHREEEETPVVAKEPSLEEIQEESVEEILADLERTVKKLRLKGLSLSAIFEIIEKYETISRLYITDDNRFFLPDYNNKEVKMAPQYKAVYLLFVNNPEGIILKRLEEKHVELVNYYKQTFGTNTLPPKILKDINTMEDPGNNQIRVVLHRIQEAFEKCMDKHLAKHYLITGKAGDLYKIALSQDLIKWDDVYE